jgi:hypothetical protein
LHLRVDAVLAVQVDHVDAEAAQRALGGLADVFGRWTTIWLPSSSKAKPLADQLLVDVRAVDLGSVEEGDAAFHGGPNERDHLVPAAWVRAVAPAHAHAAQPRGRDFEVTPEDALVHRGLSSLGTVRMLLVLLGRSRRRRGE